MQSRIRTVAGLLGTLLAAAIGCHATDKLAPPAAAPDRVEASTHQAADLLGAPLAVAPQLVAPVNRITPLQTDLAWSFTAGPAGAVSQNPFTGLTIIVPAGALTSTQTITVTALAGAPVAYRFEPSLTFNTSVTLVQDLSLTQASGLLPLVGGHFAGDNLQFVNDLVQVTETVPALVSLLNHSAIINVGHFSGWIVASG